MKPPVYSHWATLRDRFPVLRIPFTAVTSLCVCAVCVLSGVRGDGGGGGVVVGGGGGWGCLVQRKPHSGFWP